jgi:hypothetical protein
MDKMSAFLSWLIFGIRCMHCLEMTTPQHSQCSGQQSYGNSWLITSDYTVWDKLVSGWRLSGERFDTFMNHFLTLYVIYLFIYLKYSVLLLSTLEERRFIQALLFNFYRFFLFCWHVYVLAGAFFVWPWKSREPHVPFVTSHRGHCPLLIRVSCITWRISKLLKTLSFICVT